jgi:hypothetical protein
MAPTIPVEIFVRAVGLAAPAWVGPVVARANAAATRATMITKPGRLPPVSESMVFMASSLLCEFRFSQPVR